MEIILSVTSIYLFILLGYLAKRRLKDEIQEKSLVILSIYFLQPMLTFWGLSTKSLNLELIQAPIIYTIICLISILISFLMAGLFFKDKKERSIVTISSVIGNTGNLGIPLGIALFGEESIIYTSLINVANILMIYTLGVYFYSRGKFNFKDSIYNIVKLPLIWFAALAIILNILEINIPSSFEKALQMGAYASMVLQLIIFGMYLYSVKLKTIKIKLHLHVILIKFIFIPLITFFSLNFLNLDGILVSILLLELLVPLAVTNVNLAALYDCNPIDVTALVMFSSLLFIPYIIFIMSLLKKGLIF